MGNEDQAFTAHTKKSKGSTIISRKVSIHTKIRKIALEDLAEIYLMSNAIHVMRRDTSPKIVPEIEVAPTGRIKTKEDIMLTLQRMISHVGRDGKEVKITQVMKSMF